MVLKGAGGPTKTNLESRIKKFRPYCISFTGPDGEEVLGAGLVSSDGRTYQPGPTGSEWGVGAVSSDNNVITWASHTKLVRWFPAETPTTEIAGSFVVFVYGTRHGEANIAGKTWVVKGDNAGFTVVAPNMPWSGVVRASKPVKHTTTGARFRVFKIALALAPIILI